MGFWRSLATPFTSSLGIGGSNTGAAGLGFQAQSIPVEQATPLSQTNTAYGQTQTGLSQQQAFLAALQAQNGIQNQSNVYNQLAGVANGTGPNPALQQLQNTTGQNVANQAALMGGQRGAGANAGLLARQTAMQGGNIQQQAAGQGAALQAQQQLNALGQMGTISGQQVGNLSGAQNSYNQYALQQQQNLLNSASNYNTARVAQQNSINSANAGIAGHAASGQQNMLGNIMSGLGKAGSLFSSAGGGGGGGQGSLGQINDQSGAGDVSPIGNPAPDDGGSYYAARGGMIPRYANGGSVTMPLDLSSSNPNGPQSDAAKYLSTEGNQSADFASQNLLSSSLQPQPMDNSTSSGGGGMGGLSSGMGVGAIGSMVPLIQKGGSTIGNWFSKINLNDSGGYAASGDIGDYKNSADDAKIAADLAKIKEQQKQTVPQDEIDKARRRARYGASGGQVTKFSDRSEPVPGKAKIKGDSLKNDIVPAMLSPGEVVIPRHIMQSGDPASNAARFVQAVLAKNGMRK